MMTSPQERLFYIRRVQSAYAPKRKPISSTNCTDKAHSNGRLRPKSTTTPGNRTSSCQEGSRIASSRSMVDDFRIRSRSAATRSNFSRSATSFGGIAYGLDVAEMLWRIREGSIRRRSARLRKQVDEMRRAKSAPTTRSRSVNVEEEESDEHETREQARNRFRRAIRLVRFVIRFLQRMVSISDNLTTRTAAEVQWKTLNTSDTAKNLAFNPALYARNRALVKMPSWAKEILHVEPEERSEAECRRLHALLRGMKTFEKFTEKIQLALCKAFSYQSVEAHRIILRKGHIGHNFYFIYSGSVFVNLEDTDALGREFVKTETVLHKGDSFGELALLRDCKRTATIACRESCELLVVEKEVFALHCPRIFEEELDKKVQFISEIPLFHSKYWTHDSFKELCFEAQVQEYKANKVIVADNRTEEWMYICMQGRCSIIKCLPLVNEQKRKLSRRHLRPEEQMLTAEFIQSMKDDQSTSDSTTDREDSEEDEGLSVNVDQLRRASVISVDTKKRRMLDAMSLDYLNASKEEKELLEDLKEEIRKSAERKNELGEGIVSLFRLISFQLKQAKFNNINLVYLNIGTLKSNDVFDLQQTLEEYNDGESSLILVSTGARVLRIKKTHFLEKLTEQSKEHAQHLARNERYPSDSVLLHSYRENCRWNKYKHHVVQGVLNKHIMRRPLVERSKTNETQQKREESRLITALRMRKSESESRVRTKGPLALSNPLDLGEHEASNSRWLKQQDRETQEILIIQPMLPRGMGRRKSIFVS